VTIGVADFRSDTLTLPTPAMRAAMAGADVGDDVFGEDPTVRRLEQEAAAALGLEAALFVPSGTMANQVAVHVHCRPGDELIAEERSHVVLYEGGGAARLSGCQVRTLRAESGFPGPDDVAAAVRRDDVHFPRSRLLVLENTHNMAGGRVLRPAQLQVLVQTARRHRLLVHVDGARLANAAVAAGCRMAELCAGVDSVSLCLSKGLGAPVGSVLGGSTAFVAEARRARKAFGGGMRQAGVLAAAGLLALRDGPALLAADHARAQRLAAALARLPQFSLDPREIETNIVIATLRGAEPQDLLAALERAGVRALAVGPGRVRFVLHRDLGDEHLQRCLDAVHDWARRRHEAAP
jgi:threonine aldolase